ncbi:integral membrane sensor signal transduction histidine kinase [Chthoniobacter flavus Ellin428]|uniref:Integral membrane sensor signal transduction histidine kinase n=2 Tax=Chthoniobacter flavus TaxID=191863 RepID=B4D015_9BACT|nr:integral membrane sensor signal transduction histidine kinase [Chthoniobacter flavus Ellin428]TCO94224.1 signal transduction histidine kinase [Chthoniobacter flavus]
MVMVAGVDLVIPWPFSMFGFYYGIVFFVALYIPSRQTMAFASVAIVLTMVGELDGISVRGLDGFAWTAMNRLCGMFFAAGCGISLRKLREEMRHRLETLEHANELERDLVRAGEREQMRLGQDLHDGVCQTLAALNCAAECLRLDLEADVSPRVKIATEIQKSLSEATVEVRNLARGIYPIWKEGETLVSAVRSLIVRLNTLCRGRIEFRNCGDVLPLEPENAIHLYRVTQEALQNAMRHANASRIFVEIVVDDERLTLTVGDDGCGSAMQTRPDGIGWRTMKYRAKLIGAEISIASPQAGGTLVRCSLPLSVLAGSNNHVQEPLVVQH